MVDYSSYWKKSKSNVSGLRFWLLLQKKEERKTQRHVVILMGSSSIALYLSDLYCIGKVEVAEKSAHYSWEQIIIEI